MYENKNLLAVVSRFKIGFFVIAGASLVTVLASFSIYRFTENLLKERLQERLRAIVATASIIFDEVDINNIRTIADIEKPEFKIAVEKLNQIRNSNKDIKYVYLMRKTNNPLILEFIADTDSLLSDEDLDTNKDGVVEDNEMAPMPGDPYDAKLEYQGLIFDAFLRPTVEEELSADQWDLVMSAYAPIGLNSGQETAILGIDVIANDFFTLTQAALLPFLLFVLLLITLLVLSTVLLIRVWDQKVKAVQELDRQKDELLSIVSHQLATPVTSVKWYLEMLAGGDMGELKPEQKQHVVSMQSVAGNLSDLVSMILDVSRIQLGRMKIDKQSLDVSAFFKEILETVEPKALEKQVNFVKKMPASFPTADLDKRYTRMTIENLLTNAIKYTPGKGNVNFEVEVRGNTLYCKVQDTGCGIPKADQEKIFGKLFRASNVRNTVDGNGFGLYVAKGAVEAQGGKIWFESAEGKGTTFFVELPLKDK